MSRDWIIHRARYWIIHRPGHAMTLMRENGMTEKGRDGNGKNHLHLLHHHHLHLLHLHPQPPRPSPPTPSYIITIIMRNSPSSYQSRHHPSSLHSPSLAPLSFFLRHSGFHLWIIPFHRTYVTSHIIHKVRISAVHIAMALLFSGVIVLRIWTGDMITHPAEFHQ